jgi:glutathione S-transferase
MGLTLHGSQQTRSPLVSWYLLEKKIPFNMASPLPSKHPFGQVPFLADEGVEVFESGAILLYLADEYGGYASAKERASYTKWVMWANLELDGLCFGKGMSGTALDKPNKALDKLDQLLGQFDWLVDNTFSVADVAVGAYLNYVPVFFRSANPSRRPNIVKYMQRCAERPAFAEAFGQGHADAVIKGATTLWR